MAETIAALEASGELAAYRGRQGNRPKRCLYLTKEAQKDFNDPSSAVNALCGRGYIEAALTRWVSGGRVFGEEKNGRFVAGRFLKRLDPPPPEIWEIRVYEPSPQARLLGRFIDVDTLVLTKFHTRNYLGKRGSANWKSAMTDCNAIWTSLFGSALHAGHKIGDYVTENHDDFPL